LSKKPYTSSEEEDEEKEVTRSLSPRRSLSPKRVEVSSKEDDEYSDEYDRFSKNGGSRSSSSEEDVRLSPPIIRRPIAPKRITRPGMVKQIKKQPTPPEEQWFFDSGDKPRSERELDKVWTPFTQAIADKLKAIKSVNDAVTYNFNGISYIVQADERSPTGWYQRAPMRQRHVLPPLNNNKLNYKNYQSM
jgi:hypothetical protein